MSFYCALKINPYAVRQGETKEQDSPLRFTTDKEALAFGRAMFEAPQSIKEWKVEETKLKANYQFRKRLIPL